MKMPALLALATLGYTTHFYECNVTQGGQGKQCRHFHGAKLPTILLTNFGNDNKAEEDNSVAYI
jgi:hypothetical protein